jgi:hypothetical protein
MSKCFSVAIAVGLAFQQAVFRVPADEIPHQSLSIWCIKKAEGYGKNKGLIRRN